MVCGIHAEIDMARDSSDALFSCSIMLRYGVWNGPVVESLIFVSLLGIGVRSLPCPV